MTQALAAPTRSLFSLWLCLCLTLTWSTPTMAIEEPPHEVIHAEGPFEIRHYPALLVA